MHPIHICICLMFLVSGCSFDIMGESELTTEKASLEKPTLEDDRIEDKHPVWNPDMRVADRFGQVVVGLNKSKSVILLTTGPMQEEADEPIKDRLFPTFQAAMNALGDRPLIPSLEAVNTKLKYFNDGFYAAIEEAVQAGVTDIYAGKISLYSDLLAKIQADIGTVSASKRPYFEEAAIRLAAGLTLAGQSPTVLQNLKSRVDQSVSDFKEHAALSSPIGFYTWNSTLEGIFRQDRYHQLWALGPSDNSYSSNAPSFGALCVIAYELQQNPALQESYHAIIHLYAGLTNPYFAYTLEDLYPYTSALTSLDNLNQIQSEFLASHPPIYFAGGGSYSPIAIVPSSESAETKLFNRLFPEGIPEGINIMDVLIERILSGEVDLSPSEKSGWYDYQVYALETLLMPEKGPENQKLLLTKAYKEKLIETFKALLTQTRETHAKQLGMFGQGDSGPATVIIVDIFPVLHAEPFPTFYLRQARAYRFVRGIVMATMGEDFVKTVLWQTSAGVSEVALLDELDQMIRLCYGLYHLTLGDVGLAPELLEDEELEFPRQDCIDEALIWLSGTTRNGTDTLSIPGLEGAPFPPLALNQWRQDPAFIEDPRIIVPATAGNGGGKNIYWTILGVKIIRIHAEYVKGFEPEVIGSDMDTYAYDRVKINEFIANEPYLLILQQAEVRISGSVPPLTREAFRELCDRYQTQDEIIQALEALE